MMGPRAQLKLEAEKKERFEREQAAMARAARQGRRKGNAAKGRGKGRRHGRRTSSVLNRGEDATFGNGDNWNRSAAMRAIVDWAAAANRAAGLPAGRAGTSGDDGDGGVATTGMLQQFDESGRLPLARR